MCSDHIRDGVIRPHFFYLRRSELTKLIGIRLIGTAVSQPFTIRPVAGQIHGDGYISTASPMLRPIPESFPTAAMNENDSRMTPLVVVRTTDVGKHMRRFA